MGVRGALSYALAALLARSSCPEGVCRSCYVIHVHCTLPHHVCCAANVHAALGPCFSIDERTQICWLSILWSCHGIMLALDTTYRALILCLVTDLYGSGLRLACALCPFRYHILLLLWLTMARSDFFLDLPSTRLADVECEHYRYEQCLEAVEDSWTCEWTGIYLELISCPVDGRSKPNCLPSDCERTAAKKRASKLLQYSSNTVSSLLSIEYSAVSEVGSAL